ncbi:MAG: LacI family DNA-binding transcriptional regulator [Devosia sp.]|nr:LacI family DNA-binding transcriptional regulator [Devosia sp.]
MSSKRSRTTGNAPSVADVARRAGVATSTVSRALTMPGRIAEKTRLKVVAAAEELGYKPNLAARNLRLGAAKTIMIVLPGGLFVGASQVVNEVLLGIDGALVREGYSLLVANLDRFAETEEHIMDLAFGGTIAGSIVVSSPLPQAGERSLADAGLPIVAALFDLGPWGVPSVVSNDRAAMRQATEHLLGLGHRSFLYIPGPAEAYLDQDRNRRAPGLGPEENYHEIERFAGLLEALQGAGLPDNSVLRSSGGFDFETGIAAAELYLSAPTRPTAVLACIDDSAIGFIRTVMRAGVRVPQDVSVIGFDGSRVGAFINPGLASMRQQTDEIGAAVARLLLDQIQGVAEQAPMPVVIACELLTRESVAPPRSMHDAQEDAAAEDVAGRR